MKWTRLVEAIRGTRNRNGQTMIEYVSVATMLILALVIFSVLLYTFKVYGGRVLDLVASDYP